MTERLYGTMYEKEERCLEERIRNQEGPHSHVKSLGASISLRRALCTARLIVPLFSNVYCTIVKKKEQCLQKKSTQQRVEGGESVEGGGDAGK
jgi:hypothetical protein